MSAIRTNFPWSVVAVSGPSTGWSKTTTTSLKQSVGLTRGKSWACAAVPQCGQNFDQNSMFWSTECSFFREKIFRTDTPVQRSQAEEALIAQLLKNTAIDCTTTSTLGLSHSLTGRARSKVTISRTAVQGNRSIRCGSKSVTIDRNDRSRWAGIPTLHHRHVVDLIHRH